MLTATAFTKRPAGDSHYPYNRIRYWIYIPYRTDVLGPGLLRIGINIHRFATRRVVPASDYYRWRSLRIDFHAVDCIGPMYGWLPVEYRENVLGIFQRRSSAFLQHVSPHSDI